MPGWLWRNIILYDLLELEEEESVHKAEFWVRKGNPGRIPPKSQPPNRCALRKVPSPDPGWLQDFERILCWWHGERCESLLWRAIQQPVYIWISWEWYIDPRWLGLRDFLKLQEDWLEIKAEEGCDVFQADEVPKEELGKRNPPQAVRVFPIPLR